MEGKNLQKIDDELENVSGGAGGISVKQVDDIVNSLLYAHGVSSVDELPDSTRMKINKIYDNVRSYEAQMKKNEDLWKKRDAAMRGLSDNLKR